MTQQELQALQAKWFSALDKERWLRAELCKASKVLYRYENLRADLVDARNHVNQLTTELFEATLQYRRENRV